ncbi:MAG: 6-hydroxymethylpterin diphosphokinase MptE-like protein [bacterium]
MSVTNRGDGMEPFTTNFKLIQQRYPPLVSLLRKPKDLELLKSQSGQVTAKYKGIYLHSRYDPQREAKRMADQIKFGREDVVIIYGIGLGYHIKEIFDRMGPENFLIIIEADFEIFSAAISLADFSYLLTSPQVELAISVKPEALLNWLDNNFETIRHRQIWTISHQASTQLYRDYYLLMNERVQNFLKTGRELAESKFFKPNIALLKKLYPSLVERLVKPKGIEILESKTGLPTIRYKGVLIHGLEDPRGEAKKAALSADLTRTDVVFVHGFGLGYHVEELLKESNPDIKILVVEKDSNIFSAALHLVDLRPILRSPRVTLAVTATSESILKWVAANFQFLKNRGTWTIEHRPAVDLYPEYYEALSRQIKAYLENQRLQAATLARFGFEWQQNILTNLPIALANPGVKDLVNVFPSGLPVIIISAGPSLDKNIPLLNKAKGKALLIAVDTSLRPLLNQGVKPDLVVAVDPQQTNYRYFEGIDLSEGPPLVAGLITYWEILNIPGPKFIFSTNHPFDLWVSERIGDKGFLETAGGSVATVAFYLARELKGNPIIFIGQDLAYTDGLVYTRDSALIASWVDRINRFNTMEMMIYDYIKERSIITVPGIYGGEVETNRVLNEYRKWFEAEIPKCEPGTVVINATGGGARIEGTLPLPFEETLERYCQKEIPVADTLERASLIPKANIIPKLKAEFNQTARSLSRIYNLADKRLRLARRSWYEDIKKGKLGQRKSQLEDKLRAEQDAFQTLKVLFYSEIFEEMQEAKKIEDRLEANYQQDLIWYQGLKNAAKTMGQLLLEAIKRL